MVAKSKQRICKNVIEGQETAKQIESHLWSIQTKKDGSYICQLKVKETVHEIEKKKKTSGSLGN